MVPPKGPPLARSGSTWIHWWSPVASANRLTWSWVTWCQSLAPRCSPSWALRSLTSIVFAMAERYAPGAGWSARFEADDVARTADLEHVAGDRDLEREAGTAAWHALHGDVAAHLVGQVTGDVQAEPGAGLGHRLSASMKAF